MRSLVFFVSVSLALSSGGACGGKGAAPPADGSMNGSGGSAGIDARLDAPDATSTAPDGNGALPDVTPDVPAGSPDAPTGSPDAPDANRDAPSEAAVVDGAIDRAPGLDSQGNDATADRVPDAVPDAVPDGASDTARDSGADVSGGLGCGVGSLCRSLQAAYSEAIQRAKSCAGSDDACSLKAAGSLGCGGCPVWVSNKTELDNLSNRFNAGGCQMCFFGSPTGDRCHPVVCNSLGLPMCATGPSGQGTCVDRAKDRTCPVGIMTGTACSLLDDYCIGGGKVCTCTRATMTWSC